MKINKTCKVSRRYKRILVFFLSVKTWRINESCTRVVCKESHAKLYEESHAYELIIVKESLGKMNGSCRIICENEHIMNKQHVNMLIDSRVKINELY